MFKSQTNFTCYNVFFLLQYFSSGMAGIARLSKRKMHDLSTRPESPSALFDESLI